MNKIKTYYRQRLPHIQQIGTSFFVTFRLYGSIPKQKLYDLKIMYESKVLEAKRIIDTSEKNSTIYNIRKRYFEEYDALLDKVKSGPTYFENNALMDIVKAQLHRFDGEFYDLVCYSIMSNHVHMLIDTSIQIPEDLIDDELLENYVNLDTIMKRIKGASASFCNKSIDRKGQFWAKESYDMYIRNEKMMNNVITYILNNPVKAKIVNDWEDYEGNYYKY